MHYGYTATCGRRKDSKSGDHYACGMRQAEKLPG